MAASIATMNASIVASHNIGIGFGNADIFAIVLILILLITSLYIIGPDIIEDFKERYRRKHPKKPKIDKKAWNKYLKTAEKQ